MTAGSRYYTKGRRFMAEHLLISITALSAQ